MSRISIASPQQAVPIDRGRVREIVHTVLDGENEPQAEISLAFVDNSTIHTLNKRYLQHDEPTDVLSFPLSEPGAAKLSGELVIGAEVALAQAQERGHDVHAELALYVIHGLLHLCGYDDHSETNAAAMRARERHYLQQLGLPDIAPRAEEWATVPMPSEKALALVLKTTDWSETSRIATLWTREFGKVRALAKGGRRLKSSFESALDLLTVCSIVFLRKSSGSLDLLTEAQVVRRYPRLRTDLAALYAAYYVAESLTDWTEDYDPHPALFDEALDALNDFGAEGKAGPAIPVGLRVMRFEMVLLRELGYSPVLETCAACGQAVAPPGLTFSAAAGGVVCGTCRPRQRERRSLSAGAWHLLRALAEAPSPYPLPPEGEGRVRGQPGGDWNRLWDDAVRKEVRQVLGHYVTYLLGRRPRLLPYLGS